MLHRRTILGLFAFSLLVMALPSMAQKAGSPEYVVKFVCGQSRGAVVAPGQYFTAINVHNPGPEALEIRKHFSVALPAEKAGPVSGPFPAKLGPRQSFEIDCPDIIRHAGIREPFVKGFAVLESSSQLDVVAVYTTAGSTRQVQTMEIERVQARTGASATCPDLVVTKIERPEWDGTNRRSIIKAEIKNIGTAAAGPTIARVIDPSTTQPTGAPENAVAPTPALAPGASVTVTFYLLGYWVFNPDAVLDVTTDYKDQLPECDETNNTMHYELIG